MGVLALYDVTGIQDFIFFSQKLTENVGASMLVAQVLEKLLPEAIQKECGSSSMMDWEKSVTFSFLFDPKVQADIIYIGGGNALVAYRNEDIGKHITQHLSQRVLETSGNLRFTVAYHDTNFQNFHQDWQEICHKIAENKQTTVRTSPLLGISITKKGVTDGYPACEIDEKEVISKPSSLKRKIEAKSTYFDYLLGDTFRDYTFPRKIDDLGQRKGRNHIALVHIDGNSMSTLIQKAAQNHSDYSEAVMKFRSLSKDITKIYQKTFQKIIQHLVKFTQTVSFQESFQLQYNSHKAYLPIRPIVLKGDEVTWVCDGRLGISLVERFLKLIHNNPIKLIEQEMPLSACAGVAIVPSHFPFYRAYEMAENLCASAKKKGKVIARAEGQPMGSWLDFHISYEGITSDLGEVRNKNYNIPSLSRPNLLSSGSLSYQSQNLLWRPWCIAGNPEPQYQWESLKAIFREFQDWPRNRLKSLRNTFLRGGEELALLIKEYHSRGKVLPSFVGKQREFPENNMTPYFDALELLDFFVEVSDEEEKKNEA